MKERQILFSAPMVRALLDGSKTQTRRTVKTEIVMGNECYVGRRKNGYAMVYQMHIDHDRMNMRGSCPHGLPGDLLWVRETWRLTLEVTGVRVERLQDISDADVLAEGVYPTATGLYPGSPKAAYRRLWGQINGDGSWDANPWVWVIEFKRL